MLLCKQAIPLHYRNVILLLVLYNLHDGHGLVLSNLVLSCLALSLVPCPLFLVRCPWSLCLLPLLSLVPLVPCPLSRVPFVSLVPPMSPFPWPVARAPGDLSRVFCSLALVPCPLPLVSRPLSLRFSASFFVWLCCIYIYMYI